MPVWQQPHGEAWRLCFLALEAKSGPVLTQAQVDAAGGGRWARSGKEQQHWFAEHPSPAWAPHPTREPGAWLVGGPFSLPGGVWRPLPTHSLVWRVRAAMAWARERQELNQTQQGAAPGWAEEAAVSLELVMKQQPQEEELATQELHSSLRKLRAPGQPPEPAAKPDVQRAL